jgi:hypothetical protein
MPMIHFYRSGGKPVSTTRPEPGVTQIVYNTSSDANAWNVVMIIRGSSAQEPPCRAIGGSRGTLERFGRVGCGLAHSKKA